MNWKEMAIQSLRQYMPLRTACSILEQRRKRCALEIRRLRRAVEKGTGSRLALARCRVKNRQLLVQLKKNRQQLDMVRKAMSALNQQEQLVLYRLYVQPQRNNLDLLCQELEREKTTIYRRRDRALQKFTLALYGLPEEA